MSEEQFVPWLLLLVFVLFAFFRRSKRRRWRNFGTPKPFRELPSKVSNVKVGRIIDGDTVDVVYHDHKVRLRLDSIDCPEDGQEWGNTATFGLIKLIGGRSVDLETHGLDDYGRTLATVYVAGEDGNPVNVNERMVALGHAWVMRKYYNHLPKARKDSLNRIENWAKSRRVGLWKSSNPIPPWQWRSRDRN